MLLFIAGLKNDTCNFTINGIDAFIIGNRKYNESLATEMVRATRSGGIIFGVNSEVLGYIKQMKNVRQMKGAKKADYCEIYQKD